MSFVTKLYLVMDCIIFTTKFDNEMFFSYQNSIVESLFYATKFILVPKSILIVVEGKQRPTYHRISLKHISPLIINAKDLNGCLSPNIQGLQVAIEYKNIISDN